LCPCSGWRAPWRTASHTRINRPWAKACPRSGSEATNGPSMRSNTPGWCSGGTTVDGYMRIDSTLR
jgi:hypothetical protein